MIFSRFGKAGDLKRLLILKITRPLSLRCCLWFRLVSKLGFYHVEFVFISTFVLADIVD